MTGPKPTLLVVDDKRNMLSLMSKVMRDDATVVVAENGAEALRILASEPVDVVLCDLKMPDMDGLDVLRACTRLHPDAEFVLMTAYATVGTAVEALKLGAYDYLTKPFDPDAARAVLRRALTRASVMRPRVQGTDEPLPGVIGRSQSMVELSDLVRRIADSDVTTLLLGETGTGKERVARAIHQLSSRSPKKLVALNCAALPAELLESELFGHVKGAFSGAVAESKGLFEEADGGTLFLDEIGDMSLSLQAKLTRTLEERRIRRVGDTQERSVNVRLIAATHRNLQSMVGDGTFREDLWYRLNVAIVRLPPLRERRGDVELLAHHFLQQQVERKRLHEHQGFSHGAMDSLATFAWPGNVRQLRSVIERAVVISRGDRIELCDLPSELLPNGSAASYSQGLADLTWTEALQRGREDLGRRYLEAVLERSGGRVADAAARAGVERESFYRLLRKHGLDAREIRGTKKNRDDHSGK